MGIVHSSIKDEETPTSHNHHISSGDSSLGLSIFKALKGLLWKVCSIFHFAKPADPLLPVVQNPASSINTELLLLQQSPPISSPTITFPDEDWDRHYDLWCQEETYKTQIGYDDHVVVSEHQFSGSASDEMMSVAVSVEENAPFLEEMNSTEEEEEEEEVVEVKSVIDVVMREERWIKHYSSRHRILLVGEGNFSFSACLALAFRYAPNIVATSLDSQEFLKEHYGNALANIEELRSRGSKVMHGIDATTMANHQLLGNLTFDRIIFNFPYAGLKDVKNLPRQSQLALQQKLVRQFLENAREMIEEKGGEIHITHKTNGFHGDWRLVSLGYGCGLSLIQATRFNYLDYPGYNTMCGFGGNRFFNCNPSKTYKFRL